MFVSVLDRIKWFTSSVSLCCSLPPVCPVSTCRPVPSLRQRSGLEVPTVPSVSGAERAAAGGSSSTAATEGGAEGNGGAAGQRHGRGQRSTTLTLHNLLSQTLPLCLGLFTDSSLTQLKDELAEVSLRHRWLQEPQYWLTSDPTTEISYVCTRWFLLMCIRAAENGAVM